MNCKTCPVCGANWIDDQLYWSGTNKPGRNIDLAALVCNLLPEDKYVRCVNPSQGETGGIGWAERLKTIEQGLDGM
jgi:hypothetical protein